jgi:hypothetical protein
VTVHDAGVVDTSIIASDLQIAATAGSNQLALYTANPDDFRVIERLVEIVGIQAKPRLQADLPRMTVLVRGVGLPVTGRC